MTDLSSCGCEPDAVCSIALPDAPDGLDEADELDGLVVSAQKDPAFYSVGELVCGVGAAVLGVCYGVHQLVEEVVFFQQWVVRL